MYMCNYAAYAISLGVGYTASLENTAHSILKVSISKNTKCDHKVGYLKSGHILAHVYVRTYVCIAMCMYICLCIF